ncbi:cell division protein FtsK [Fructilactobacillus lindneri]|nr:DNA translocase FtsK [Fructilactobacillus lindneri]ANZ58278.1 cell division protein FtsK [Fructilactobacillus lindneri]ANZ59600.1 cell division protein FtsK [Fructilactobacillus lindneri]POG98616.1 cell division protein FtsK [Fructilactobacillus lindneri]POH04004.1 cell division protein FtsK [Fructilactobacillus lindneri]POH04754.1 cell division protein FtsK [Fructilactobacillus lindneri]
MEHYDGPAFFRKYFNGEKASRNFAINQFQNKSNKVNIEKQSKHLSKNNKKNTFTPKGKDLGLVQKTESFKPIESNIKHNYYNFSGNKISSQYLKAIKELEKNTANFILYAEKPKIGVIESNSIDLINDDKKATIQTISSEKGKKKLYDQQPLDDDVKSQSHENENENTVDNLEIEKKNHVHHKELGHSLSDIFNNENGLADHLPLFNQPKGKTVNNAATLNENKDVDHDQIKSKDDFTSDHDEINNSLIDSKSNLNDGSNKLISQSNERVEDNDNVRQFSEHNYQFPSDKLLNPPVNSNENNDMDEWIENQAQTLDDTLQAFHVQGHVTDWTNGPTVTQFQVKLDLGVKVNKITNLNDDLKMALAAKDIRIEAPIPGKSTVGIEIPNPDPRPVMLSEILESSLFKQENFSTDVALGVNIEGFPVTADIRKMPHALIAGATGSGKSVFINSLLLSLLYHATPRDLRMILIDPKAVELAPYDGIPHLISPVISDPKEAAAALKWVTTEMDNRYERLAASGVRNIEQYNKLAHENNRDVDKLPYILVVIDELADLMMVASSEVQDYIVRITQKARAAGIHLVVATQRPSVDIVTGTIKNNIPTRIAFMVSSQVDSRTIIDQSGAERLLGKGDMLYLGNGANKPERLQGAFVTNKEVEKVTDFIRTQGNPHYEFEPKSLLKSVDQAASHDDLWQQILQYVANEDTISTSKLQRTFSIGYNRAANIIDDLERNNFVSSQHGAKPRDIYLNEADLKKLNI